jgi:hypothetical protein
VEPVPGSRRLEVFRALKILAVYCNCVADPGSGAFLPRIRDGEENPYPRSGICNKHPGSYFQEQSNYYFGLKMLKFFVTDPGSSAFFTMIRNLGWKKKNPGSAAR